MRRTDWKILKVRACPPHLVVDSACGGPGSGCCFSQSRNIASVGPDQGCGYIDGIRDNQLVGYGLVVGLHGYRRQLADRVSGANSSLGAGADGHHRSANRLQQRQQYAGENMAGVFVVATLPPFSQPGYKLDITVSSAGDARSLEGGILLMTPLYGPDGQIYAEAQGALVLAATWLPPGAPAGR